MPIRIIIADDHYLFRTCLKPVIESFKDVIVVGEAADGLQVLEMIRKLSPDIVLLDLQMPNLNGLLVLDKIKGYCKETRAIVLSMHNSDAIVANVMERGAAGFLDKNVAPVEMEIAINTVYNSEFYFNDKVNKAMLNRMVNGRRRALALKDDIQLNDSELGVLKYVCAELNSGEIAKRMFLSQRTVEGIRLELMRKVGARNVVGLITYAMKRGLIDFAEEKLDA